MAVEVAALIESVDHDYPEKSVHLRFFLCRLPEGEPKALGCADFRWVERDGLKQFSFPAADAGLLQKLQTATELWK